MNIPVEIDALARENLRTLSPETRTNFEALLKSGSLAAHGERLRGTEPDVFMTRLANNIRIVYRMLDEGKRILVLNVYTPNSVFDRS